MSTINNTLKIAFVILISFGCENNTAQYEYTIYRDGHIRFLRESMNGKYKYSLENGDFLMDTPEGDTLVVGKYQHGFRIGRWEYHPSDTQTIYINWTKYHADDYSVEINYPEGWELIKSDVRAFQATFPTQSDVKDDKYFIILPQKKSELGISLNEYWNVFNKETHFRDSVKSHLLRKFSREDGDYYLSTYTVVRNNEELFIFSFLGATDSTIYDITYSSLKEDIDRKYTIFLDMIRSLRLENKRFFTPYDQSTKIVNLKYPPDPEIMS